jgi:hypothetical protein
MKRFLLASLALMLVMSTSGQVFAAAFCPRALGHECCFAQTVSHTHSSSNHENTAAHHMHVDDMSMDAMNLDDMAMANASTDHMAMNDMMIDVAIVNVSIPFSPRASSEAAASKFDQPAEPCAHCVGHSGIANAPVSFVGVPDQSGKELGSILLQVSGFLVRPNATLVQLGLPREHAPPGTNAPRHILISVFLI